MSENDTESTASESAVDEPSAISDDQLPPDLVASEDNPLAEGRPAGEDSDVLEEGKRADEMADPDEGGEDDTEQHEA